MDQLLREDIIFLSDIYLSLEEYESCIKTLNKAIELDSHLSYSEQTLLVTPYRKLISKLRLNLSNVCQVSLMPDIERESQLQGLEILKTEFISKITTLCHEICSLVTDILLPKSENLMEKAMYHLIIADFSRYLSELEISESTEAAEASHDNYQVAKQYSEECLQKVHPLSLNIILNFSILLNDVLNRKDEAIEIATNIYNDCITQITQLEDLEDQKTAMSILQKMKDNTIEWSGLNNDLE